jgi:hypothetical protein
VNENIKHFRRAIEFNRAIVEIINSGMSPFEIKVAIDALPEYKSRGHGGKFHKRQPNAHNFNPSKYNPHQGKKECARRVACG